MVSEQTIRKFVRAELDKVAARDFDLLRRIPSTTTWRIVDYVSALAPSERNELLESFADISVFHFLRYRDPNLHAYKTGHVAYRQFVETVAQMPDLQCKYCSAFELRMILKYRDSAEPPPDEVIRRATSIAATNAREIRKAIKAAFSDRFHATAENCGGGDWVYHCSFNARAFDVDIDYGGQVDQLRYGVFYSDPATGMETRLLTYEGMLGMGHGCWDYVTAQNLSESVTVLCQLVEELVVIPERLDT
jgi:hypothetical protein